MRRNSATFSKLFDLTDRELRAKISDRIHNLRTLQYCNPKKQEKTLQETEQYFVPVVQKRFPEVLDFFLREMAQAKKVH
jgi:(p)ppGpp synthase/HD superfamily hydrolase